MDILTTLLQLLQTTPTYHTSLLLKLLGRRTINGTQVFNFTLMLNEAINSKKIHYISGQRSRTMSKIIMRDFNVQEEFDNLETFLNSSIKTPKSKITKSLLILLSNPIVTKDNSDTIKSVEMNPLVTETEMRAALQQFMPIFKVIKNSVLQQEVQESFAGSTKQTELTSEIKKVNHKQEYFFILARILRYYMTVFVNNIKESNLKDAIKLAQETTDAKFFQEEPKEITLNVKLMSTLHLYLQKAKDKTGTLEALTTNESYLIGVLKGLAQKYSLSFDAMQHAIHSILTLGSIRCTSYVQGRSTTLFNLFDTTNARCTRDVVQAFNNFIQEDIIKALIELKQDAKLNISKEAKKEIKKNGFYEIKNADNRTFTCTSMNASTTRKIVQHLTGGLCVEVVKKFRGVFKEQKAASFYSTAFSGNWTFMLGIIKKNAERQFAHS